MDILFGLIGRMAVVLFCFMVVVVAWEVLRARLFDHNKPDRKPEPLTIFHVDGSKNHYMVPTLDEARDLADWLENDGQLVGFWIEKIEV